MANYEANLRVTADTRQVDQATSKLDRIERQLRRRQELQVGTSAVDRALQGVQQNLNRLQQRARVEVQVNTGRAQQAISGLNRQLGSLRNRTVDVAVRVRENPATRSFLAGAATSGVLQGGLLGRIGAGAGTGAIAGPKGAAIGAAGAAASELLAGGGPAGAAANQAASLNKLNIALREVAGSQDAYLAAQREINKLSADFATPLRANTQAFISLGAATQSAGLGIGDTADVIRGLTAANTALGGDAEKLNRILLATSQVFSKGKVTAEELRGQIGESLPGAFTKFAEATGRTTAQLDDDLEKGKVGLGDFLLFTNRLAADYSGTAEKIAKSSENAGARMTAAWERATTSVGRLLVPLGAALQNFATRVLNTVADTANGITGLIDKAIAQAARLNKIPAFQGVFGNLQAPTGPQQGPPVPDRLTRKPGGLPPDGTGTGTNKFKPSSQAQALINAAKTLGVSPLDLATIISYETIGTFSPSIRGGTGGNYMGLIQFGGPERAQYGASPNQSFEEQVQGPVVRFLQDRFRNVGRSTQGATLADLYRTINGGNPNAPLSASDGNGTIAQHIQRMTGAHRRKALDRFFGGTAANVPYGAAEAGADAAQGWQEQQRARQEAAEREQRRQQGLNDAATQALEIERDRALVGQSRLDQLVIEDDYGKRILKSQLDRLNADQQLDPSVRAAQRQNLINQFDAEAKQRQQQYQDVLLEIGNIETAATDLGRSLSGVFAVQTDPFQAEVEAVKEELRAADKAAEDLLTDLSKIGGTLPETEKARKALGNLRGRIAGADPATIAGDRLARPLREGLQNDADRLQLERGATRQGRGLNRAEELALDPTFQALPQARQKELQDLANRNDLLAQGNTELGRTVALTQSIGQELATGISSAITGLIQGTQTLNESLSQVLANIGQILIQNAVTGLLGKISIGGTPLISGFAGGGDPPVGRPSLVGEQGPELFVPREAGTVIPADTTAELMRRYRPGQNSRTTSGSGGTSGGTGGEGAAAGGGDTVIRFESTVINGVEFVTREEAEEMSRSAARQGAQGGYAMVGRDLMNKRSVRSRWGVR